jgi:hypothetical protein
MDSTGENTDILSLPNRAKYRASLGGLRKFSRRGLNTARSAKTEKEGVYSSLHQPATNMLLDHSAVASTHMTEAPGSSGFQSHLCSTLHK